MSKIRDVESDDQYQDKLVKILPSELTATYFILRSLAGDNAQLTPLLIFLAVILCIAFYVIAPRLIGMTTQKNRFLYCITFFVWVLAIDPHRIATDVIQLNPDWILRFVFLVSGLATIWSFFAPLFMDRRGGQL